MSVLLTLEVVSPNGAPLGAARRKTFGAEGGRIGRAPECEWVLVNPYISRHHATVGYQGGRFYIESTGENGVAVNAASAMLARQERYPLSPGDHLFIDEFEVLVSLDSGSGVEMAPAGTPVSGAGFLDDVLAPPAAPVGAASPSSRSYGSFGTMELDPLRQLPGAASPAEPWRGARAAAIPDESWNHSSALDDSFTPPAVFAPNPAPVSGSGAAPGAAVIPEDWDKTSIGRQPARASPPAAIATAAPGASAATPASAATTRVVAPRGGGTAAPPLPPSPPPNRGNNPPWPRPPNLSTAPTGAFRPAAGRPLPPPSAVPRPAPEPAAAKPAAADDGASGLDLASLLASAGVDPAQVPPETAAMLGAILRLVVEGTIDVLRARGEIKSEFRLPMTRLKMTENNPLKFSVNAEDALASLLQRRNPAYLQPVEAFRDAFDDIRAHQLAMLAGMRAGFDHVLSRLDPAQLQQDFDRIGKRGGLLGMGAKSRYWDLFEEHFRKLTADRDEAFRKLFGEDFAQAYERQLEALKRAGPRERR